MFGASAWCIKQKVEQNRLCELRQCSAVAVNSSATSLRRKRGADELENIPLENGETEEEFLTRLLDDELNKEVLDLDAIHFILNRAAWQPAKAAPPKEVTDCWFLSSL